MSDIHTMPLKTSAEMLAKKLYEIEDFAREALQSRPGAVGEDWAYLMNALADVKKICADELGEYRTPKAVRGVKRHYLELPRDITLKRFVNTGRTVKFIGQYNDSENPCNVNPRRIYTIDVEPMCGESEERDPATVKSFEVSCREDGKLLFRITTMRGRTIAEYLGVKSLKAWRNCCGSKRRGKHSRKLHAKRNKGK